MDGGKTWDKVLYFSPKTGVIDLAMDPRNPDVLYAAKEDPVKITIKDIKKQVVKTMEVKAFRGLNAAEWDLKSDATSRPVPIGEYTVEVQAGNTVEKKSLKVTSRFSMQGLYMQGL